MKSTQNWYALYVNARHEKMVGNKLTEKGIETYLPLRKTMNQWSDRKKLVESPLLPGYIFVRLAAPEMEKPRYVPGVMNYVRLQGRPAVIRNEEIEGLRFFTEHGYSVEACTDEPMDVGMSVGLSLSDFKGRVGVIDELVGDHFAIVRFEGLSMDFRVRFPVKALQKVKL